MSDYFLERRNRLRKKLQVKGLDAVLIRYAANRYYLSGFELHDVQSNESSGCLLIAADGTDWLATDVRYRDAAQKIWPSEHILIYHRDQAQSLCDLMRKCGTKIGIETETMSLKFYKELLKHKRGFYFQKVDGLVEELRIVKDGAEMAAIEKSFALNHKMLSWLEEELVVGRSETEMSWMIERFFRENGAEELAFPSIVAVNQQAAMPHAIPGSQKISPECLVLVDVGCRVDGYCSDQTRTFWVGKNSSLRFTETLALVREAQRQAMNCMRAGVCCAVPYIAARKVFEEAKVADYFTHGLGHGVGLETHEKPSLSPHADDILEEGMVVTVEPGLYYPEWGGVRWEHTVVIEKEGVRVL